MLQNFPHFNVTEVINVTYYRLEFLTPSVGLRPVKKFRTEEHAKKHAKRVLCLDDDSRLESKAVIIPVNRSGISI